MAIALQADIFRCDELQQASVVFTFLGSGDPVSVLMGMGQGALLVMDLAPTGYFWRTVSYRNKTKLDFQNYGTAVELESLLTSALLSDKYSVAVTHYNVAAADMQEATNILK